MLVILICMMSILLLQCYLVKVPKVVSNLQGSLWSKPRNVCEIDLLLSIYKIMPAYMNVRKVTL